MRNTPNIIELIRQLRLDKLGEILAEEVSRVQIGVLCEEREVLARMIARLDERIAKLGGKPKAAIAAALLPASREPRRRKARITPKPGETLKDFVLKALARTGGPVKVSTLVDLVLEAGYKTNAKRSTLVTSTYTVLTDKQLFRRLGKGIFALAAGAAKRQRKPRNGKKAAKKRSLARESSSGTTAGNAGEPLQVFILRAFRKARHPMMASDIAKRVKTLGYRTTSTPEALYSSIEHLLGDKELFRSAGKGLYELALPGTTKGRGGRPKQTAKAAPPPAAEEPKTPASAHTAGSATAAGGQSASAARADDAKAE